MSLFVVPDLLAAAAGDLAVIEQALSAGNAAAAVPTARVTAAAADEVSEAIAALFGAYAQQYQVISAQAMTFHHRLVLSLGASAGSFAFAEATNASAVQSVGQALLAVINAPT
ncbi:PE family protein, partial [Mycobacterium gordonae]|uniref:PE family protein n=1 Tax=Mycobacterium gordonae TaxID=1778 RepID=UPI0009F17D53